MWTRGKDKEQPGKFAFELFDMEGAPVQRVGGFNTAQEADRAAERAQRNLLLYGAPDGPPPIDIDTDQLLRDLLA